jgi:hypothetical protein
VREGMRGEKNVTPGARERVQRDLGTRADEPGTTGAEAAGGLHDERGRGAAARDGEDGGVSQVPDHAGILVKTNTQSMQVGMREEWWEQELRPHFFGKFYVGAEAPTP